MFYYYGRKKQIARHYPAPIHETIIEPFAGAASYSMHDANWRRRVILIEKDARVCDIWRWLIEVATPAKIAALPTLHVGEKSSEFLHIVHAATKMAFKYRTIKVTPVLERNWEISKRVMAASVHKVKHWELVQGDFSDAPDLEATWFIDPPYRNGPGDGYAHGCAQLDYKKLGEWIATRQGQLVCCEGPDGDYLPFRPLLTLPGVAGKLSVERLYHRASRPDGNKQLFDVETEPLLAT